MAPPQPARLATDRRLRNILAFVTEFQRQLPAAAASKTSTSTIQELEKNISSFPENLNVTKSSQCEELDHSGTAIWNLCTRLRRNYDADQPQDVPLVLLLARVYAFLLVDSAHAESKRAGGALVRLMRTGVKAVKSCLGKSMPAQRRSALTVAERKEYQLASKVIGRVSLYEAAMKKPAAEQTKEEREECEKLVAEYYVLRTALAWHQSQFEMAEHMFVKSIGAKQFFDPSTAESLADVLFEMGTDLLAKQQYPMAVKWLERADEVLNGQELDLLSVDAEELRKSILQSLTKALLGLKDVAAAERARGLVDLLQNRVGDQLVVLLLRLELLSATVPDEGIPFDGASYLDILQRMIRTLQLDDNNFKLIMFHIRKLTDKSPSLAIKALDEFLILRVVHEDHGDRFEKALVTRLWIATNHRDDPEHLTQLEDLFSALVAKSTRPTSAAATLAAHTLLWKRIESSYTSGQFDVAEKWCKLALHPIFEKSGGLNMARISRKLLLCALARTDLGSAREIFSSMPDTAKNEPMSRFLMYKIALRCQDIDMAAENLHFIGSASTKDPKLLYACALDAQKVGDRVQTLAALQLVLERCGYEPSSINLASLLRLSISLMVQVLDETKKMPNGAAEAECMVEKLCTMYEKSVVAAQKARQAKKKESDLIWTIDELHWFSKNSYNLGIKNLANWRPQQIIRILSCCIGFIDQYPEDINQQLVEDLSLRRMFCDFTAATALVGLARGEDNLEVQLQNYIQIRKHVNSFDTHLQTKVGTLEEAAEMDLRQKLTVLAAFDFEAACHLKSWDELSEIVLKADASKSSQVYEIMADIVLCSKAPTSTVVQILKKIIDKTWAIELLDATKLAKYIRCLFQIALSDDVEVAEQLLDQVCGYASEAAETDQPWPSEELEWMATKAFNHAVDFYCAGEDDRSRAWADKALSVAQYCADEGALERLLQSKLVELKFDT